jgi:EAL domain-containing protein (putative c-di-GMP-specific phosphodiesterase class I)
VLLRVRNVLHTRALYAKLQRDKQVLQGALDERAAWQRQREAQRQQKIERLEHLLTVGALSTVWQPIKDLRTLETVGVEALTRVASHPTRSPHVLFSEAAEVGMGLRFELAAVSAALDTLGLLPTQHFLSVNASPHTAQSAELSDLLLSGSSHRVVVELTEHAAVEGYEGLKGALEELRSRGARIAIDDAGAGYASLQHILKLRPDIIKLDSSLTLGINADPARRALASALVSFGRDIGAEIVAEGIETEQELEVLQTLGVPWGQGYYLGKPTLPCLVPDQVERNDTIRHLPLHEPRS